MATLYTSNLETVKEGTVNLDTWVKVKKKTTKNLSYKYDCKCSGPRHEAVG